MFLSKRSSVRSLVCLFVSGIMTCATSVAGSGIPDSPAKRQSPPNVLVIVVDDLGWTDLGCYGSGFYETPSLDKFAQSAVRFTNAYSTCPVCSPTRVSIMTGRYPQRNGLTDYAGAPQPQNWKRNTPLLPAPYRLELALEETTLAEIFRQAGYATCFAGKWHLGGEPYYPQQQGFDVNIGGCEWGHPRGGKHFFSPYANPSMSDGPDGEYLPERLASETVNFITSHRDKPFLAVLSFYEVHTPLMTTPKLKEKYQTKKQSIRFAGPLFVDRDGRKVRQVQEHAVYAGMVEAMDSATGRVLDTLDELGLAENTLVVFTSDNGGLSTSEGHPTSNLPLRAGKGWMYEGGIRVPMIVRAPGKKYSSGSENDTPVNSNDIFPTATEYAGLNAPSSNPLDGTSLLPAMSGEKAGADRPLFWHYPHYGNQGGSPSAAVRRGNWKLIHFFEDDHRAMYNLADDIGEDNDVAGKHPEILQEMRTLLDQWSQDVGAKFPTRKQ